MKENRIKIIADINHIYNGNIEEGKDLIFQLSEIGIDGITLDITKEGDKRVTERELLWIKAFTDLANIKLYPFIKHFLCLDMLEKVGIDSYISESIFSIISIKDGDNTYKLFTADDIPTNPFPTFDYLNYFGFIDNIDGITASIIAMAKGARYIVKPIVDKKVKGGIGFEELKELCDFRDSIERIIL